MGLIDFKFSFYYEAVLGDRMGKVMRFIDLLVKSDWGRILMLISVLFFSVYWFFFCLPIDQINPPSPLSKMSSSSSLPQMRALSLPSITGNSTLESLPHEAHKLPPSEVSTSNIQFETQELPSTIGDGKPMPISISDKPMPLGINGSPPLPDFNSTTMH